MMGPGQSGGAGKTLQLRQGPHRLDDCWQLSRSGGWCVWTFQNFLHFTMCRQHGDKSLGEVQNGMQYKGAAISMIGAD